MQKKVTCGCQYRANVKKQFMDTLSYIPGAINNILHIDYLDTQWLTTLEISFCIIIIIIFLTHLKSCVREVFLVWNNRLPFLIYCVAIHNLLKSCVVLSHEAKRLSHQCFSVENCQTLC